MDMKLVMPRLNVDLAALNQTLPVVFTALCVVGLSSGVAQLTWSLVPIEERPLPTGSDGPSSRVIAAPNVAQGIDPLPSWHLFGLATEKPVTPVAEAVPQDAPDTQLRLTLTGVYASDNPQRAFAIIAEMGGKDELYHVDSNLPGGAILKEVHADRVILLRNNRYETLRLPEDNVLGLNDLPSRRPFPTAAAPVVNRGQVSAEGIALLRDYKQRLQNDPQSVMDALRAEPYRVGGEIKGYRIFPGRDKRLMGDVGLQPGDVVTSVNGISLDNPIKGLELMKQLPTVTEVSVEVLRNGVSQTLVVPVN